MLLKLIFVICSINHFLTGTLVPHSIHGVGARIEGDQLFLIDNLSSPKSQTPQNHTIQFNYPIYKKVISYIELSSNSNVYADLTIGVDVNQSDPNRNQWLRGSVTALKSLDFHFKISVFGFDEMNMPTEFKSLLQPDIQLAGAMVPQKWDDELYTDEDEYDDEYNDEEEDMVLVIGDRQPGDEIIHTAMEFSDTSDLRKNHTVSFYYVDDNFITVAKFVTLRTTTARAEYSQISAHTLKAVIHDENVFNLDVSLEIYGYKPENLPNDYVPPHSHEKSTHNMFSTTATATTSPKKIINLSSKSISKKLCNLLFALIFFKAFF